MRWTLDAVVCALILAAPVAVQAQGPAQDTLAASVVQRFGDAANARDAKGMAAEVSPTASFEYFPSSRVMVAGRDSIQAFYARLLGTLPADFKISIRSRIVEGQIVIDEELFAGMPPAQSKNTWMYLVRHGLIERAWVVIGTPPRPQ